MQTAERVQEPEPPLLMHLRRDLAARCRNRSRELVDALAGRYRHELAPYGQPVDPTQYRAMAATSVEAMLLAVEDRSPFGDSARLPIEPLLGFEGLPLEALSNASDAATRLIWQALSDELSDMVLAPDVATALLRTVGAVIFDASAQRSAELRRHLDVNGAERGQPSDRALRRQTFEALLVSPHLGEQTLRRAADRASLRIGDQNVVAVVTLRRAITAPVSGGGLIAEIAHVLSSIRIGNWPIVEPRTTEVVGIFPLDRQAGASKLVQRLIVALRDMGPRKGSEIRAAVGGTHAGVGGISTSYQQALRTLDASWDLSNVEPVLSYTDILPVLLLLDNPVLAADVRKSTIDVLAKHDAQYQSELVRTLQALLAERCNVSAAAKRLHIHRHTLAARQQRLESLTGMKLTRPRDALLLELGLQSSELRPIA